MLNTHICHNDTKNPPMWLYVKLITPNYSDDDVCEPPRAQSQSNGVVNMKVICNGAVARTLVWETLLRLYSWGDPDSSANYILQPQVHRPFQIFWPNSVAPWTRYAGWMNEVTSPFAPTIISTSDRLTHTCGALCDGSAFFLSVSYSGFVRPVFASTLPVTSHL